VLTQFVPGTVAQLNVEGRDKRYQDSELFPALKDYNGAEILARLTLTQQITSDLVVQANTSISKLNARSGPQGYRYYDYGLALSYSYEAPFRLTSMPWNATVSATHGYYIYDQPDPLVDPDNTRFDRDWRFALVGSVPLDTDWSVIGTLGRTVRQSSIENFVFNNNYVSLAAQWRF